MIINVGRMFDMKKNSREDRSSPTQDKLTAGNGGWRSLLLLAQNIWTSWVETTWYWYWWTTWSRTNDLQHWTRWKAIREWCHTAVHCYGTAPKYKRCFHEMISKWKTNFLPERLNTLNTILLFLFHKSHVSKNIDQLLRLTVCWNLISCNFASWPWVGQVIAR